MTKIRDAMIKDSSAILRIRNTWEIRKQCNHDTLISKDDHNNWYLESLKNNSQFLVIIYDSDIVGYLRVDNKEIAIAIEPKHQRQLFATRLMSRLFAVRNDVIIARVKKGNEGSIRFFMSCGFIRSYSTTSHEILII